MQSSSSTSTMILYKNKSILAQAKYFFRVQKYEMFLEE